MDDQTVATLKRLVTAAFVGTWITLPIVGFVLSRRMDIAAKRRWMPRSVILVGVLFVLFSSTLTVLESRSLASLSLLVLVIPAVALISFLNIRFTKFCDQCGAIQYNNNWFVTHRFCSKCGAQLDAGKSPSGDDRLE